jgi:ABC-type polysaccharide/polyol phosphate export permease
MGEIMNNMRAVMAAFSQQWKAMFTSITSLSFLISAVPTVAVLAWIAIRSNNQQVLTYLLVGAPLGGIWSGMVFRIGWSLTDELHAHTLEFAMISQTPMALVMFGKSLAQLVYAIPTGIVSLITMLLVTRQVPMIADLPLLIVSLFFVLIALIITSLLFAPLMVVVGGQAGFFNAILPLGILINGFMFPIERLPLALETVARMLPLSWAMSGVWQSINGTGTLTSALGAWGLCILTSAGLLGVTYLMFKVVIKRIRVTGVLGTYQ